MRKQKIKFPRRPVSFERQLKTLQLKHRAILRQIREVDRDIEIYEQIKATETMLREKYAPVA